MSRFATTKLLLAVLLLGGLPAVAQQHPNTARGFSSTGSYNPGDVDTVNTFNGNLVIRIPIGQTYPVNGGLSFKLALTYNNNVWDYQQDGVTQAIPNRMSNAGLGWMVTLGRLNPPSSTDVDTSRTTYMSPDGALHTFYDTMHEGEATVAGVKYTRDGSYLRFQSATNEVEFPDGTIHHFNALGNPDQIRDRFSNQISVDYGTANQWIITDGHRTHRVYFRTDMAPFNQNVDHIDLAAFNGQTATYTFRYSNDDGTPVTLTGCRNADPATANQAVPLLTQVTLPDGSFYRMAASDYGTQTTTPCNSGMLLGMNLPTLGRIEWDYMEYVFPQGSSTRFFRQRSSGVSKRRLLDAATPRVLLGEWSYTTALTTDANHTQPQELVNTIVSPLGDKTVNYFSVSTLSSDPAGWSSFDYGLPFTRFVTDGGSLTRYLSSQTYDCDAGAVNCQLKRSNFVTYDRDAGVWSSTMEENTRKNQRVLSTRTNYDDNGLMEAAVNSSFDGFGHYRQTDLFGNYGAGDTRTTVINYNPGQTYPGAFTPLAASTPWVVETFTDATTTEGGASTKTEYCYDTSTGFLQRIRTLAAGASRTANDVVVRYTPTLDGKGNVGTEESFGGDFGGLDTVASLCTLALPANQFQINYTYQYGSLKTVQYAPVINYKTVDRDIDANTGLTIRSRDVTGLLQTSYDYDTLSRPTWVKPAQDGWVRKIYTPATSASSLASTYSSQLANGGGTVLAESKTLYDALGRVRQEQQRMPDGTYSTRAYAYNALGWKTSISEQGATNKITTFLNFDPFGRPAIVRPPEGGSHDVTFSFSGKRSMTRTAKVATSYNTTTGAAGETSASLTETYDRQGRLIQVTEPNNVITKYEYDVGNHLKRVCQNASGTSTCGQERLFTYDSRGFLTSEKHPEKGASGNGTVSYLSYDSRGHARRMIDGPNDLTFTFDKAERLWQVKETSGGQRPLKVYTYATDNPVGNPRKGKVSQAQRYNYHILGGVAHTVLLTETYTYGGREGRVSQRSIQNSVDGGTNESFTQSFTWNELGDSATIDYPNCTMAGCASAARTVTNLYTNGWLTGVQGYTGTVAGQAAGVGITYFANGLVKDIAHSNGMNVTQTNDPNSRQRPASITASNAGGTLWTSGTYQYDGSGNIWKAGTSWYEYDSLSRVKTGTVFPDPLGTGTQQQQSYIYDNYGNLGSITTTIGANMPTIRVTSTSTSTNRLTGTVTYDSAGNLTSWNGSTYEYDAFNQMRRQVVSGEETIFSYTADDERIWSYNLTLQRSHWTVRDLNGKVLRDFLNNGGVWSVEEDYIYRNNGLLLAGYLGNGQRRHFALDHLGTPRLVTNSAANQVGYHAYSPYGEEATPFDASVDRMQLTGHERDVNSQTGATPFADDLDYMHARHFGPLTGRFLSVDRMPGNKHLPQSWNRYAYVVGNPVNLKDPSGMFPCGDHGEFDCDDSITVTTTPYNWDSFNDFLLGSYYFFSGFGNAWASDQFLGVGRYEQNIPSYQWGQAAGDLVAVYTGIQETMLGVEVFAAGGVLDLTIEGAVIGVPANAVGAAAALHGSAVATQAMSRLNDKRKKPGSLGEFKGKDAKSRENKMVRDALKELGQGGDKDLQKRVHQELNKLKEVLNFEELKNFIRGFLD